MRFSGEVQVLLPTLDTTCKIIWPRLNDRRVNIQVSGSILIICLQVTLFIWLHFHCYTLIRWLLTNNKLYWLFRLWEYVILLLLKGSTSPRRYITSSSWLIIFILLISSLNCSSLMYPSFCESISLKRFVKFCKNFSCSSSWKSKMIF